MAAQQRTIRKPWFRYGEDRLRIAFQGETVALDPEDIKRGEEVGAFVEMLKAEPVSEAPSKDADETPARRPRAKRS